MCLWEKLKENEQQRSFQTLFFFFFPIVTVQQFHKWWKDGGFRNFLFKICSFFVCLFVQLFYFVIKRGRYFCRQSDVLRPSVEWLVLCVPSLSLGWKAGAFSVSFHGLIPTNSYIRPHGVSFSLYIHDWHLRQSSPNSIFGFPLFVVWLQLFVSPVTFWLTSVNSLYPHRRHYSRNISWTL